MAQSTALDIYRAKLISTSFHDIRKFFDKEDVYSAQAKERLKEQMIEFAMICHQEILKDKNAPQELISMDKNLFELFYNAIFKK
jgi:hypothetical protein